MSEKMTLELVLSVIDRSVKVLRELKCPAHAAELSEARSVVSAHFAQPAQAVDVGAIREVAYAIQQHRGDKAFYRALADKLTRALGNAQAEGWSVPEGWEIDVGEKSAAIRHRTGSKLVIKPERGNALLFNLLHQLAKSIPTPPTQATPNAHE